MELRDLVRTTLAGRMGLDYQDWARLQGDGPHTGGRSVAPPIRAAAQMAKARLRANFKFPVRLPLAVRSEKVNALEF